MGRLLMWGLMVLGVAALAWCLLEDGEFGADSGHYVGLTDEPGERDEGPQGPGLEVRHAGPALIEDVVEVGEAFIRGIVLDGQGKPLAGQEITAALLPDTRLRGVGQNRRAALRLFEAPPRPGKVVATAVSEADGSFKLEALLDGRRYRVLAKVAAPLYSTRADWAATLKRQWTLRVLVGEGAPLKARVVDADGKSIQAWVSARRQQSIAPRPWLSFTWNEPAFKTGADGRFHLPSVPLGTLLFTVTVPERGSRSNIPVDIPAEGEVELRFEDASGATVEGRVVDTKGHAVPKARISVQTRPERAGGYQTMTSRAGVTAEDGTFKVERLQVGVIQAVNVIAEGYVTPPALGSGMPVTEEKPARLDIVLARGAVIQGLVSDATGQPIVGAEMVATRSQAGYGRWMQAVASTTTGPDGRYTLTDVPLGPGSLRATAEGYYQPKGDEGAASPYPWMQMQVGLVYDASEEGQELEKNITLKPGTPLQGIVKGEDGAPVAGVQVSITPVQNRGWYGYQSRRKSNIALSDAEGAFQFPGVEPDKSYNLNASNATHLAETLKVEVPKEGAPKAIELVLKEGASFEGHVLEADGTPASGAQVLVNSTTLSDIADADGAFLIQGLKEGSWTVQVSGMNPVPASAKHTAKVEWGVHEDGIELTVPTTLFIKGVVLDIDGKPTAGLSISARRMVQQGNRRRQRGNYNATSDSKGRFEVRGLPEGDYQFYAGGVKHDRLVSAGSEDVILEYREKEYQYVEGRVLQVDGRPVARGSLRIWYGDPTKRNSNLQAMITGGYFRGRILSRYREVDLEPLSAFDPAGRPLNFLRKRTKNLDASAGQLELRLEDGLEISGVVSDAAGNGLPGMQVRATKKGKRNYGWGWGGRMQVQTGEDGSFTVSGLQEGEYTVKVTPGGSWMNPEPQTAEAGDKELEFKLKRGLTIEGKVFDPEEVSLAGASVWVNETQNSRNARGVGKAPRDWASQARFRTTSGTDGTFSIAGLPEDALYHVGASGSRKDEPYTSTTVNDVSPGTKDVVIRLGRGAFIEGEVVGPDGEPVTRGWLQARPVDRKSGLSSGNGNMNGRSNTFKIGPIQPGRYKVTLRVQGGGYGNPEAFEVDAPARGLRIEVPKAMTVRGQLRGDDIKGFMVTFVQEGSSNGTGVGTNGEFTITGAKKKMGRLFAYKRGDSRYAWLENVEAGLGPYDLSLQEGGAIRGYVENLPVNFKRGQIYASGGGVWIQGTLSSDGGFIITGLPPGKYMVQSWISGGSVQPIRDVEPEKETVALTFVSNK